MGFSPRISPEPLGPDKTSDIVEYLHFPIAHSLKVSVKGVDCMHAQR